MMLQLQHDNHSSKINADACSSTWISWQSIINTQDENGVIAILSEAGERVLVMIQTCKNIAQCTWVSNGDRQ